MCSRCRKRLVAGRAIADIVLCKDHGQSGVKIRDYVAGRLVKSARSRRRRVFPRSANVRVSCVSEGSGDDAVGLGCAQIAKRQAHDAGAVWGPRRSLGWCCQAKSIDDRLIEGPIPVESEHRLSRWQYTIRWSLFLLLARMNVRAACTAREHGIRPAAIVCPRNCRCDDFSSLMTLAVARDLNYRRPREHR
jgi:hypothetical protein